MPRWHPQYVPSMGPHWCPNMGNRPDTFPFGVGPRVRDSIGSPTPYPICADKGHNRERSQGGGREIGGYDKVGGLGKVYRGEGDIRDIRWQDRRNVW